MMISMFVALFALCGLMTVRSQNACDTVTCVNGYCTLNALAQAVCQCERGYKPSNAPGVCIDIDECVEYDFLCDNNNGYCFNTLGSYYCNDVDIKTQDKQQHQQIPFSLYAQLLPGGRRR